MRLDKYKAFMCSYVDFMEALAASEHEKYAAIISYDHRRIDHAVSNQQAMNMRLEKLEQQREKEQQAAGIEGFTAPELLEHAQGAEREQFEELFKRLKKAVNEVRFYNGKCISFAQDGMRMMGVGAAGQSASYGSDGKRMDGIQAASLFETKI